MNNITQTIEGQIINFMNSLYSMNNEVNDLVHYYFNTTATTLVSGLATNTTPATVATAIDKAQFINGITICQQLQNFFGNVAVAQTDYETYANGLINGSTPANTPLSNDVENIGIRLKALAQNVIQLKKDATNTVKAYNSSYLSAIIGGIPASNVVYGCNTPQAKFVSGVVLLMQYENFVTNQSVVPGDYLSTIVNWVLGA